MGDTGYVPRLNEGLMVRTRLNDSGIKSRIIAKRRKSDSFQLNKRALVRIILVPS